MHDVGLYQKNYYLHFTIGHKRARNVYMKCLNTGFFYIINITEIQTREIHFTLSQLFFVYGFYTIFCLSIRMVKLIACANLSTTSRLVDHMCPARRYDLLMKLFSSVQYNNLINVYITLFLCRTCPNKYEPDKVLCRGLGYSLWSPFSF